MTEVKLTRVHEFDRIDEQYFVEIDLNEINVVDLLVESPLSLKPQVEMCFQEEVQID